MSGRDDEDKLTSLLEALKSAAELVDAVRGATLIDDEQLGAAVDELNDAMFSVRAMLAERKKP